MKSLKELKDAADRAFVLLEQKSPHQLAVKLVSMGDRVQGAIDACVRMQEQRDQLAFQLKDATSQCAVAADLLRELREGAEIHLHNCTVCKNEQGIVNWTSKLERIDALLAGKLPECPDTEWTDAASTPTAADYRELQARHDQLQSKYKAALDVVRDLVELPYSTGGLMERLEVRERARDLLAGQVPDHTEQPLAMAPEGWQLEALDNDRIVVRKDGVGFYVASFNAENIASTILHTLASDMLAAAPKP